MKRQEFISWLDLSGSGLFLPRGILDQEDIVLYDNDLRGLPHYAYGKLHQSIQPGDPLTLKREEENVVSANLHDQGVALRSYVSEHERHGEKGIRIHVDLLKSGEALKPKLADKRADQTMDKYSFITNDQENTILWKCLQAAVKESTVNG